MTRDTVRSRDELRDFLAQTGYAYEKRLHVSSENASASETPEKRIGMYYTPVEVASRVVKNVLKLLLFHKDGTPKNLEEVLALRIYDPALGAGVFLLETCFQITDFLAEQGENASDIPLKIAKNCLFGSDIDAEAVRIARGVLKTFVSAECSEVQKENFSWLEQNILCADSLKIWGTTEIHSPFSAAVRFDAVLGNPPFLGGRKIRRVLGDAYFQYLTQNFTSGGSGNADLCVYFFLLAQRILRLGGVCGFIATNTISEGDSRRTGLDVLLAHGAVIYCVESFPWTETAAVQVTAVHLFFPDTETGKDEKKCMNLISSMYGKHIPKIPASLKFLETFQTTRHFSENESLCYQGYVLAAKGFILTPEEAEDLWNEDEKYKDVIVPYITGDDVFSAPDPMNRKPRRYVIYFRDWTLEQAKEYPRALEIVRKRVLPVRAQARRKAHRENWWLFGDKRPIFTKIVHEKGLKTFFLQTRHAKFLSPMQVPAGPIYSESAILFPTESREFQAILTSSLHEIWVRETSSSLGNEMRYSPTDCFYTFPFPGKKIGSFEYFEYRSKICISEQVGITFLYNRFHDISETSEEIQTLRGLHRENDLHVLAAYGWNDLNLSYDFQETVRGIRWELLPDIRKEILLRLASVQNNARFSE